MVGDPSRGSTTQICSSERQLGVRQSYCGSGFKKPLKWPRYNSRVGFRFRSSSTSQCLYFVVVNPVLRLSAQSKEWEKWIIKMAIVHPSSATMGQSTWTKNPIKELMTRAEKSRRQLSSLRYDDPFPVWIKGYLLLAPYPEGSTCIGLQVAVYGHPGRFQVGIT